MWSSVTAVATVCTSMAVRFSARFSARVSALRSVDTTSLALSAARATAATPLDTSAVLVRHRSPYLQQQLYSFANQHRWLLVTGWLGWFPFVARSIF